MNPVWLEQASNCAKFGLKSAIESRDMRNVARSCVELREIAELCDTHMRGWAKDFAATVRDWNLNPRTGDLK